MKYTPKYSKEELKAMRGMNDVIALDALFDQEREQYLRTQSSLLKIASDTVAVEKEWDRDNKKDLSPEQAYTFLEEAGSVLKARAELRDSAGGERTAAKIAQVFNAITDHQLTEADAWTFLLVLKLVRSRGGSYNRDDYVDLASYASLLGECESVARRLND